MKTRGWVIVISFTNSALLILLVLATAWPSEAHQVSRRSDQTFTLLSQPNRIGLQQVSSYPSARTSHAMTYDSRRGVVVLFGGNTNTGLSNDTWEWNGVSWVQRTPANSPLARSSHGMAYDSARGVVVLFGGQKDQSDTNHFDDTWEWNGVNWTQRTSTTHPSARRKPAMAYDSTRNVVTLFGGWNGNSYFDDTWEWAGTNWTQRAPTSRPSKRFAADMVYDSVRNVSVLFGGDYSSNFFDDTWEWNGVNWVMRNPSNHPSKRKRHAMVYDPIRKVTTLFGGIATNTGPEFDDTWEWDGNNWLKRSPVNYPAARHSHSMIYDSAQGVAVLFGGNTGANVNDMWKWDGVNWTKLAPYSISGRILNENNQPIPGVTISGSGGYITTTDSNGNYTLNGLLVGSYMLTASHTSYAFLPSLRTAMIPPDATAQDFVGSSNPCPTGLITANNNQCTWPHFLDLPIEYDGTRPSFVITLQNHNYVKDKLNQGRVNSWFDHSYPIYSNDTDTSLWIYNRKYSGVRDKRGGLICYNGFCYSGHNGIDFSCLKKPDPSKPKNAICEGSDKQIIYAAASGKVVKVQTIDKGGYGKYIVIYHNNNYFTLYGHLKEISSWIKEGTDVTRGQPIAIMGDTGNSKGTHLHFGVYVDNNRQGKWDGESIDKPVDPYGWWKQEKGDPWRPFSGRLWLHDPTVLMSFPGEQNTMFTDSTDAVRATVSPGTFTGQVTLELSPGPVAGASAQLRQAGSSFWLILREWLSGLTQSSNTLATQITAQNLNKPVTLTVSYSEDSIRHLNVNQLGLYHWDENQQNWELLPGTVNQTDKVITAQTQELGDFSLQAPLLCPADSLELNDDFYTASSISLEGTPTNVLFDISTDQDWFGLDATHGFTYTLQTANLATGVNTIIEVYDIDGITLLASDDNSGGSLASLLEWVAPEDGTYYVRIVQAPGSAYGCSAAYNLAIRQEGNNTIYLPIILK